MIISSSIITPVSSRTANKRVNLIVSPGFLLCRDIAILLFIFIFIFATVIACSLTVLHRSTVLDRSIGTRP